MTRAREILPKRFYLLTRSCTQHQFWLRPDDATNETFLYCLADAARRFSIEIIFVTVMSNHHHTVLFDRHGHIIEFTEHLHKMIARAMNVLRDRDENFWSSAPPSLVHLVDPSDVLAKLVYAATNPVKDNLVERVHHWPGVNSFADVVNNRPVQVRRPRHFFRRNGRMPPTVTLRYVIPPELGPAVEVRATLRQAVEAEERRLLADRRAHGRRVLGRRGVLRQACADRPASPAPSGGLKPRVAAKNRTSRIGALRGSAEFQRAYTAARLALLAGESPRFPIGTYWLRRFAGVPVGPPPPSTAN